MRHLRAKPLSSRVWSIPPLTREQEKCCYLAACRSESETCGRVATLWRKINLAARRRAKSGVPISPSQMLGCE